MTLLYVVAALVAGFLAGWFVALSTMKTLLSDKPYMSRVAAHRGWCEQQKRSA